MSDLGDFISRVVLALEDAGLAYMFVGSIASTLHGPPRSTQDIDIVVALNRADVEPLLRRFPDDRYYVSREAVHDAVARRTTFNIIDLASGWKADIIVRKDRAFSVAELARRLPAVILGAHTWVATIEDTLLAKLEWSRLAGGSARQLEDVRALVRARLVAIDRDYVERGAVELGVLEEWQRVLGGTA